MARGRERSSCSSRANENKENSVSFELRTEHGTLEQIAVDPRHRLWDHYVEIVAQYIETHWPEALESTTRSAFRKQYDEELRRRIDEGGRHLILWRRHEATVGFADAYVTGSGRRKELNVAEFSVVESMRRNGWGRLLFQALLDVGRRAGTHRVVVEVDKPMPSNAFWQAVLGACDASGERNVYSAPLKLGEWPA